MSRLLGILQREPMRDFFFFYCHELLDINFSECFQSIAVIILTDALVIQ